MHLELEHKVGLVTGGSKGIGFAIARVLSQEGVNVAICGRNKTALDEAATLISDETGKDARGFVCDVSKEDDVNHLADNVIQVFGKIDILVNNAGMPGGLAKGPLATVTDEKLLEDLSTKTLGALRCCKVVAPHMQRQGRGSIINIAGISARTGGTYSTGMRNIAISHMSQTLAHELGPSGINVNVVHPGLTRTPYIDQMMVRLANEKGISVDEVQDKFSKGNATRRVVNAIEIAHIVAFLASPKAIAITGCVIDASGGANRIVLP